MKKLQSPSASSWSIRFVRWFNERPYLDLLEYADCSDGQYVGPLVKLTR